MRVLLLISLGVVAAMEWRIGPVIAILVELALCYSLIYVSGLGLSSSFFVFLLLPVISGASNFGLRDPMVEILAAA